MKVANVMTKAPAYCSPETNLAAAVEILWKNNCGVLPVMDSGENVVGVVTDRDICVALGTRNRLASEIAVKDVTWRQVVTCKSEDDVRRALQTMAQANVRRLPVVDAAGKLQGILSMDDIVMHTDPGSSRLDSEATAEEIINTLRTVYEQQPRRAERGKGTTA